MSVLIVCVPPLPPQLWTFVDEYLRTAPARGMATSDILAFLFEIGFCGPGEGYAVHALTASQRELLDEFAAFGLVFVPEDQETTRPPDGGEAEPTVDPRRFFPSTLAIILTQPDLGVGSSPPPTTSATTAGVVKPPAPPLGPSGITPAAPSAGEAGSGGGGGALEGEARRFASASPSAASSVLLMRGGAADLRLIVEKNFKVYAYSSVDLHLALLALFAKIELRLPNLVVATLTRRSVMTALEKGVSAAQIRRFLSSRVHPAVAAVGLEVPENVVDQLFLWERERSRVAYKSGTLISGIDGDGAMFRGLLDHLLGLNGVVFADEGTLCMVVLDRHVGEAKAWAQGRGAGAGATIVVE